MRKMPLLSAVLLLFAVPISAAEAPKSSGIPPAPEWRDVDPGNLLLIDTRYDQIAVELAPQMAPGHVARIRALVRAHFYDGKSFYRVIDGFVAQGGLGEGTAATGGAVANDKRNKDWPLLKAEFDAPYGGIFTPLGNADPFAPLVGHIDGFPVARDEQDKRQWLIHCPGTFAFARDDKPDTAATEFYIVIGQAPRRLDRDLTAFGRVIDGMQYLQKLERGDPAVNNGVIADGKPKDRILAMHIGSDILAPHYRIMRTETVAFEKAKEERRHPTSPFYFRLPPPVLDICLTPVAMQRWDLLVQRVNVKP